METKTEKKTEKKKVSPNITQAATFLACGITAGVPTNLLFWNVQGILSNTSYSVKPREKVCK